MLKIGTNAGNKDGVASGWRWKKSDGEQAARRSSQAGGGSGRGWWPMCVTLIRQADVGT